MFDSLFDKCEVLEPHKRHWHRKWWQLRERECIGVSEDPWLRANPSLGILNHQVRDAFGVLPPVKHKHRFILKNKVLVTPAGLPVSPWNIYWQCSHPNCWDIYFINRQGLREELLRKPVDQTWPA